VLITGAADTDEIVHNSAKMCRKRGKIVLVGMVGLNLRRDDFYEKELSFQVSCSYGPGRYDDKYEQGGQDYPYGFVRWTEQRNFQAVLSALHSGAMKVEDLITHRFDLEQAVEAYTAIAKDSGALGVVLNYRGQVRHEPMLRVTTKPAVPVTGPRFGVIGAGSFSRATLLPSLAKAKANLKCVADINATAARDLAAKYRAEQAVTDYKLLLYDPEVAAVLIAVQHNLHARLVCECLQAGKHVFVEKPLAMNEGELQEVVETAARAPDRLIMVGFNRRFSPHVRRAKQLLAGRSGPLCMTMTINAGYIPPEHWVHDPVRGGGRIIGEACHFIDLLAFLVESPVVTVSAASVGPGPANRDDKMCIVLGFGDGSVGTVNYFANGSKSYPKETLDIFTDNRVLRLENFRRLRGFGWKGFSRLATLRQDKGHAAELAAFIDCVTKGGDPLIPLDQLVNVTRASFAAVTAANERRTVCLF
jgi:predicted dehydrogenase